MHSLLLIRTLTGLPLVIRSTYKTFRATCTVRLTGSWLLLPLAVIDSASSTWSQLAPSLIGEPTCESSFSCSRLFMFSLQAYSSGRASRCIQSYLEHGTFLLQITIPRVPSPFLLYDPIPLLVDIRLLKSARTSYEW